MKICIVGSGVVGQATGRGFLAKGRNVTFSDINPAVIQKLRQEGHAAFTIEELNSSDDFDYDVTIFTVSTPTVNGEVKLDYLKAAAADLGKRLAKTSKYHLAVVRSTVPPGTTENLLLPIIEEHSQKKVGRDFGLCMNPEYLREVSAKEDFAKPWIIVFGEHDQRSGDMLEKVYEGFTCPIHRISIAEAELQKYVHNLFNAAKIAFFNEMRDVAKKSGINPDRVFRLVAQSAEAMWNPEYGIRDFGPFQGSCLPKDTRGFLTWAEKNGWEMPYLRAAVETNEALFLKKLYQQTNL